MDKEFLPIGTVVLMKGGTKRLMITGYLPIIKEEKKIYDYSGCLYPEGFLSSEQVGFFNHENIEKIIYMGEREDPETKEFIEKLKEDYKKIRKMVENEQNKKEEIKPKYTSTKIQ